MPPKRKNKSKSKKTKNQKSQIVVNVNSFNKRKSSTVKHGGGGGGAVPFFHSVQPAPAPQIIYLQQHEPPRHHLAPPIRVPTMQDFQQQTLQQGRDPVREEEVAESIIHAREQEKMRDIRLNKFAKALNETKQDNSSIASSRGSGMSSKTVLDAEALLPVGENRSAGADWSEPSRHSNADRELLEAYQNLPRFPDRDIRETREMETQITPNTAKAMQTKPKDPKRVAAGLKAASTRRKNIELHVQHAAAGLVTNAIRNAAKNRAKKTQPMNA